jgi:glycosyltransferase involved in cell wall biosynthesis
MPSKTYFSMAAGSALLTISSAASDLARIVAEHDCGVNVDPSDHGAMVVAIRLYRANPALLARHRANARQAAEREFAKSVCLPRLLDVIAPAR